MEEFIDDRLLRTRGLSHLLFWRMHCPQGHRLGVHGWPSSTSFLSSSSSCCSSGFTTWSSAHSSSCRTMVRILLGSSSPEGPPPPNSSSQSWVVVLVSTTWHNKPTLCVEWNNTPQTVHVLGGESRLGFVYLGW